MSRNLRRVLLHYFKKLGTATPIATRGISTFVPGRSPIKVNVIEPGFSFRHNSKLLTIPRNVRLLSSGTDTKRVLRQKLWKVLRILFLVTGGVVWGLPAFLYLGFKSGLINVEVEEQDETEHIRHDQRLFTIFDVSEDAEHDSRAREISDKNSALMQIWSKLKHEDGVLRKFGEPVDLIGYYGSIHLVISRRKAIILIHKNTSKVEMQYIKIQKQWMNKSWKRTEKKNESGIVEWCVACLVAGPKQTGIMKLEFSKVNKEWVPISLHLEGLETTGDVVCNISGPTPNGITRFIRLSND